MRRPQEDKPVRLSLDEVRRLKAAALAAKRGTVDRVEVYAKGKLLGIRRIRYDG